MEERQVKMEWGESKRGRKRDGGFRMLEADCK
jgi:hypothetical protein